MTPTPGGRVSRHKSIIHRDPHQSWEPRVIDSHRKEGEEILKHSHCLEDLEKSCSRRPETTRSCMFTESKIISESQIGEKITNQYDRALTEKVMRPSVMQDYVDKDIIINREEPEIIERTVEKIVECVVEKPVPHYIEIEVPYDVYIERPIERVIEKEIVTERVVEKHYDKIVEVPIERIIEKYIEHEIEVPVYIEEIVEVPVERIIEDIVETIIEEEVYHDRIEEIDVCDIEHYRHKGHTILPTKVITDHQHIDVDRPVYLENLIEQIVGKKKKFVFKIFFNRT
jgi:hypothetical protein